MTPPTAVHEMETDTGQTTGTRFAHWADDNTVVITTRNSLGDHRVTLAGHEAKELRDFLVAAFKKPKVK